MHCSSSPDFHLRLFYISEHRNNRPLELPISVLVRYNREQIRARTNEQTASLAAFPDSIQNPESLRYYTHQTLVTPTNISRCLYWESSHIKSSLRMPSVIPYPAHILVYFFHPYCIIRILYVQSLSSHF